MAIITGYARKPDPKWPYYLGITAVFLFCIISWLVFASLNNSIERQKAKNIKSTKIEQATKTSMTAAATTTMPQRIEPTRSKAKLKVEKIIITSRVNERNLPMDSLNNIPLEKTGRLYCYTRIGGVEQAQPIRHVWLAPGGEKIAEINLIIRNQPADTWSYVNLSGQEAGEWEVQVRNESGSVLAQKNFVLY